MRMIKTSSNVIVALILIMVVSSLVFAQGGTPTGPGQQTTKGAVVKGKAPVNREVLKVKLPRAECVVLQSPHRHRWENSILAGPNRDWNDCW